MNINDCAKATRALRPCLAMAGLILLLWARAASGVNGLLDSDMAIYVSGGSSFTSLAAEGHLHLKPNGTGYSGTFVDNLGSARSYPAFATGVSEANIDGNYVIFTANGRFTFKIGGPFASTVPIKYGEGAAIGTILYAVHAYKVHPSLAVTLGSFTIGAFVRPVTGTLSLTTDGIGYIVPFSAPLGIDSSFRYLLNGHSITYQITSYGRYSPIDGLGNGSLTTVLRVGLIPLNILNAQESGGSITGDCFNGSGKGTTQTSFSAR